MPSERGYWVNDMFGPWKRFDTADAAWAFVRSVSDTQRGRVGCWVTFVF